MGSAAKRLKRLNKDLDDVATKSDIFFEAHESATDDETRKHRWKRWKMLQKTQKILHREKEALLACLPGKGAHTPLSAYD